MFGGGDRLWLCDLSGTAWGMSRAQHGGRGSGHRLWWFTPKPFIDFGQTIGLGFPQSEMRVKTLAQGAVGLNEANRENREACGPTRARPQASS